MKQSHITTPRTLNECQFHYVGYAQARRKDEDYKLIDWVIYAALAGVLFGFLIGALK